MDLATPTGNRDISEVNVGDSLSSYDSENNPITNPLLKKDLVTADTYAKTIVWEAGYLINGIIKVAYSEILIINGEEKEARNNVHVDRNWYISISISF